MKASLFVRELGKEGKQGALRQIAADSFEEISEFVQGAKKCLTCPDTMDARVEVESMLGCVTSGPILALINCKG